MAKVKICGINSTAAFDAVVEAGADFLAFNLFERSPRFVTAERAAALNARHSGGPLRVGLFVEPPAAAVLAALSLLRLDILQIYGGVALCRQIREATGLQVWRAIGVSAAADLPAEDQGLDGFIIESKAPQDAGRPGGNAQPMDWSLLKDWAAPCPWMLAGGLNPDNVAAAIAATGAPGVDVSSGVETAPGEKSSALIRAFVKAAKAQT